MVRLHSQGDPLLGGPRSSGHRAVVWWRASRSGSCRLRVAARQVRMDPKRCPRSTRIRGGSDALTRTLCGSMEASPSMQEDLMSGRFEAYTDKACDHRFPLKAANGQVIASGQGMSPRCRASTASTRSRTTPRTRTSSKSTPDRFALGLPDAGLLRRSLRVAIPTTFCYRSPARRGVVLTLCGATTKPNVA